MIGDFNTVASSSEKDGGRPVTSSSSNGLYQLGLAHGLVDLGFSRGPFSWSNRRSGHQLIQECLDRGLANAEWRLLWPRASIRHIPRAASDHSTLLLDTCGDQQGPKPFHFEAIWLRDSRSKDVVRSTWDADVTGSPAFCLVKKILHARDWNRTVFGALQTKLRGLEAELDWLQSSDGEIYWPEHEVFVRQELLNVQKMEEDLWCLKSHTT